MDTGTIASIVEGMTHKETQVAEAHVDLTVAEVHAVTAPGQLDFGGSERQAADTTRIEPKKREADDEHGWYQLEPGTYLVTYNEHLDTERLAFLLQPSAALLEAGASHPTRVVHTLGRVPVTVPGPGLRIKENARISNLVHLPGGR